MSSTNTIPQTMSGHEFIRLVNKELERRNRGLETLSLTKLSLSSGLSDAYLRRLAASRNPNPSSKAIRLVLFTLGYEIANPEEDVIPHLRSKGVFNSDVHGENRKKDEDAA